MTLGHTDSIGDELPPGASLCNGQYTVERYLSAGGFGVTYVARDSLGRHVVIKECFPSAMCFRDKQTVCVRSTGKAVEFDTILELFEKEALALAALQHPHIVAVHQFFRDNGTAYMAMDYVEGRTLPDIIESEPDRLTPEFVKTLLNRILEAISYIHRHDILHRDISPDNIIVDDDNIPVLIDFGAAREDASRVSRVLSKVLTVKDGYSPPEFYLSGNKQVYSSDLYALAATFYHVLVGQAPADGNARMAPAAREETDPLSALGQVEGYVPAFIAAIQRCLALFPKDRIASADEWRDALDQARKSQRLLQRAAEDQQIDNVVAQLVQDFFHDFKPVEVGADKRKDEPEVPAPPPAPLLGFTSLDDPDEDDVSDEVAAEPSPPPLPERFGPAEPKLAPIEKMRAKYAKPLPPEEPEAEAEKPAEPMGWLSRFSRHVTAR